jgi:hypothetical protein
MSSGVESEATELRKKIDTSTKKPKSTPVRREKNTHQITIIDSPLQQDALFLNNVSYLNQVCIQVKSTIFLNCLKITVKCCCFSLILFNNNIWIQSRKTPISVFHFITPCPIYKKSLRKINC